MSSITSFATALADTPLPAGRDRPRELSALLDDFSVETTPGAAAKLASHADHLRAGTRVYIAHVAGGDYGSVVEVARRLRAEGMTPVPHIPARSIASRDELDLWLARLSGEAGVEDVLAIAGGLSRPFGPFADSMAVLETGLLDRHGIRRIGLAGHPEGTRDIAEPALREALARKNAFRDRTDADLWLVTQFCFNAEAIIAWDKRIRAQGNRLPVHIGIAGLASLKTLVRYARLCGVGPSMRALTRNASNVARLATEAAPDGVLAALARYKATDPDCGIERAHFFPFGGIPRTAAWAYAAAAGRTVFRPDGQGFQVVAAG